MVGGVAAPLKPVILWSGGYIGHWQSCGIGYPSKSPVPQKIG